MKLIERNPDGGWTVRYGDLTKTLPYKPTMEGLKSIILGLENAKIDQEILQGFVWSGMSVWLSGENQFNYKAAYDLAVQTQGKSLPVVFKFGGPDNPEYHFFETLEDITDFYTSAMGYINQTLASGWSRKDSIPWEDYRKALEGEA